MHLPHASNALPSSYDRRDAARAGSSVVEVNGETLGMAPPPPVESKVEVDNDKVRLSSGDRAPTA